MPMLAEVAPAAPALAAFLELAVLFFTFALTWLVRILVLALFGWLIDFLASIPGIGKYLAYPFIKIEQALAYALGKAEHAIDAAIGASWHLLARYMEWMWREIRGQAVLALEIVSGIYPLVVAYHALKSWLHHLTATNTATAAKVKTLEREYHGIDRQLRTLEREYHGIDQIAVRRRLSAVEREIGTIQAQTIPAIQHADRDAASAISNLYEWAKGKASLLGIGTFSFAVATAIGLDAFNGLRCRQWGGLNRRWGCGLGTLLNDLLGLATAGIALEGVCEFLPEIEAAFGAVAGPMVHILNEVPLGACETVPDGWAALTVRRGPLPPSQALGQLAA